MLQIYVVFMIELDITGRLTRVYLSERVVFGFYISGLILYSTKSCNENQYYNQKTINNILLFVN